MYYGIGAYDYYYCRQIDSPGVVKNLFTIDMGPDGDLFGYIPHAVIPVRALYFSIVTMTTLGFGDMHATPDGWLGHVLLSVQVILGYVILGALITRLSVLFTSGGPNK